MNGHTPRTVTALRDGSTGMPGLRDTRPPRTSLRSTPAEHVCCANPQPPCRACRGTSVSRRSCRPGGRVHRVVASQLPAGGRVHRKTRLSLSQNTQTRVSFFLVSISSAHQMKLLCVWVGGGWGGVGGRGGGELGGDGRTMDDGRWTMAANLPVSRAAALDHHKHQHLHALRAVSSAQKQLFGK